MRLATLGLSEHALEAGRRLEPACVGQHETEQGERFDVARLNFGRAAQLSFGLLVPFPYQERARFREATQSGGRPAGQHATVALTGLVAMAQLFEKRSKAKLSSGSRGCNLVALGKASAAESIADRRCHRCGGREICSPRPANVLR
jgi:hypothetical protein